MKKKLLTLFMAFVLVCTNSTTAFAAESLNDKEPTEMEGAIPTVSGKEALAAIGKDDSVVLDIRSAADYNQAHIKGSISNPVCQADFTVTTDERDAFIKYAKDNISTDKKVYLICYVGTFCVNFASKWLTDNGYDAENLYRVTGGVWNDADLGAACNSTHYDYAMKDVTLGNGVILDVRANDVYYANGYVDKSLHQPLFKDNNGGVTSGSDDLATNFSAFINANKNYLSGKNIYILCNSGKSGAANATALLAKAGYKTVPSNEGCDVFTIENGAKSDINKSFVNNQSIANAEGAKAVGNKDIVIIDVRAKAVADANPLKGENVYAQPLFNRVNNSNKVTSGSDDLAMNFLKFVKDNSAKLNAKDIYILCNSGASGAKAATKLLMQAGYSTKDIFTITNGAAGLEMRYAFLTKTQAVSNADAAKAVGSKDVVILDVRATEVSNANPLKGDNVFAKPVFNRVDNKNVVVEKNTDKLADEFITFAKDNKDLAGKKIYILCNSGQSGARAATVLLTDANYSLDDIYTITFGATGLEMRYKFIESKTGKAVTGAEAVAAVEDNNVVILDVRNNEKYAAGHLNNSISAPVFDSANKPVDTANDQLAKDFISIVTEKQALLEGKEIYILCNGGQRGARAATVLLGDAKFDLSKVHTITGGASDANVQKAFTTDPTSFYIDGQTAVTNAKNTEKNTIIIDVRKESVRQTNGTIAGTLNWPLFDDKGVTSGKDDLANAFKANIAANADKLAGKDIYILCNSGNSGAKAATKLLVAAGYNQNDIFTITDGAKGLDVRYAMLGESPTVPVTSADALNAVKTDNDNIVILDVRASGNFAKGHLKGAVSAPLFDTKGVVKTADIDKYPLVGKFLETVAPYTGKAKSSDYAGQEFYILCNSGQSGARAATVLLHKEAGVPLDKIHTITGGYNLNEDIKAAAIYVTPERAINAAETPETDKLIIDVRAAELYAAGHLKGSVSLPLFDSGKNLPDDLAEAFVKAVKANPKAFEGKTVYILCNSGSRGAVKATELLAGLGITDVFTIEGGAASETIKPYLYEKTANTLEDLVPNDDASDSDDTDIEDDSDVEAESETDSTDTVKTGDTTNIMPYALTMAFALLAIVLVGKKKFTK